MRPTEPRTRRAARQRKRHIFLRRRIAGVAVTAIAMGGLIAGLAGSSQAASSYSLFGSADTGGAQVDPESADLELGLRFTTGKAGYVSSIRFLKAPGDINQRSVTLWSSSGRKIATAQSSNETASGWQEVSLPQPVAMQPGRSYVVSYHALRYMSTENYFRNSVSSGPIRAWRNRNGLYHYGSGFPVHSYRSSNYWVDIVFTTGSTPPPVTTPPTTNPVPTTSTPTAAPTAAPTTPNPPVTTPQPPATTVPPTTSPPSGGTLALPRIPWDGGPAFYSKFPKAHASGWDDPSFFPISVFFGKPEHAPKLKALGINTYMNAEHDGSRMSVITDTGISVLAGDEWTPAEVGDNARVVGWVVSDECDMGIGCDGSNTQENLLDQQSMIKAIQSRNDGRFTHANFGNGVLGTYWAKGTMNSFVQGVDVASVDKYAYTSRPVRDVISGSPAWPSGANLASSATYGWLSDQLRSYMNPAALHPGWVFVETGRPFLNESDALVIKPAQIEGAVWSSLIHEARGIAYFQHSNDPTCATYSLVQCDTARQEVVKAVDAQVKSLAPVLNTQSYVWDFKSGADTMLKTYSGSAYIFADVGLKQTTGTKTFTLPPGVKGSTVTVIDEDRTLPVTNGTFTDSFASEYTHHIYKVTL